ncbi:CHAP domain protein [Rhodobacteraceae bacterium THAF1]|uniref:CHAP domain-containing protein n=1 Tax=Palleronia sp. THAF1 TaxID=2587842 RepID=UPI000F3C4943|nr:CHAP domain-containing protein [Palleronia sp. THAF1]QFU09011.1 CHAP domain protein [Palleronia sp. THAF1]VDC24243.1 CHAP domain protein [Rhodobacteraceae bacterium THAF1]
MIIGNGSFGLRLPALCATLLIVAACGARAPEVTRAAPNFGLSQTLLTQAVQTATQMRQAGQRVWCVPFARNASGIQIRGDAHTWWASATETPGVMRTQTPVNGAVMVFSKSSRLNRGHVAVVSGVDGPRAIRIHHANWKKNHVSLDMKVIDISDNNDWSRVRVESVPGAFGSPYSVSGFIAKTGVAS